MGNDNIPIELFFYQVLKNQQIGEGNCDISNYKKHIEISKQLGLINETDENIFLTKYGLEYYELIPQMNGKKLVDKKNDK